MIDKICIYSNVYYGYGYNIKYEWDNKQAFVIYRKIHARNAFKTAHIHV